MEYHFCAHNVIVCIIKATHNVILAHNVIPNMLLLKGCYSAGITWYRKFAILDVMVPII